MSAPLGTCLAQECTHGSKQCPRYPQGTMYIFPWLTDGCISFFCILLALIRLQKHAAHPLHVLHLVPSRPLEVASSSTASQSGSIACTSPHALCLQCRDPWLLLILSCEVGYVAQHFFSLGTALLTTTVLNCVPRGGRNQCHSPALEHAAPGSSVLFLASPPQLPRVLSSIYGL